MSKATALQVEYVSISSLKRYARNPRTHSKKQVRQIARSIQTFGWTNPILVDQDGMIIAGHGRLGAAELLGLTEVPIIRIEHMTEAQVRAYILADNKLAENAGWDRELLALELGDLLEMDLGFDITDIGFEMGEIDNLIVDLSPDAPDEIDAVPEIDETRAPVTCRGDLWALDKHRLLCADALTPDSFARLLGDEKADLVFTDPPYNVPIPGHASGKGRSAHPDFMMASGEMPRAEFIEFLKTATRNLADHSRNGSIHFICMDWRHLFDLLLATEGIYAQQTNLCVWNKSNGGMGSLYRSRHELIAVFKKGTAPHVNNVSLGVHGRNRTNVWDYPGMSSFQPGRDELLEMHPTVKPVAMVHDAILDCSNRGDAVLDAFAGSGTTIIAAHRAGRRGFGIELDARYVDVALLRFRKLTGIEPIHVETGETYDKRVKRVHG